MAGIFGHLSQAGVASPASGAVATSTPTLLGSETFRPTPMDLVASASSPNLPTRPSTAFSATPGAMETSPQLAPNSGRQSTDFFASTSGCRVGAIDGSADIFSDFEGNDLERPPQVQDLNQSFCLTVVS